MPPDWVHVFWTVVAGGTGLVVGSFLNVVIWRLPRGESLMHPRSACPGCGHPIQWFDNIPVLSWILLRGRCRGCKMRIALRYPLVELATGGLFLLAFDRAEPHAVTVCVMALVFAALLAVTLIDWDHRIIPDKITKPGMVLLVAIAPFTQLHPEAWIAGVKPDLNQLLHAAAGLVVGGGLIIAIRLLGPYILRAWYVLARKKDPPEEVMGMGDQKLLAMIGAAVGPQLVLYAFFLALLSGIALGLVMFVVGLFRGVSADVTVKGDGIDIAASTLRVRDGELLVRAGGSVEAGTPVNVVMVLPARIILEDDDATVRAKGHVVAATGSLWTLALEGLNTDDRERVAFLQWAHHMIPFGPSLAIGGAAALAYGADLEWFMREVFAPWSRSLIVG